MKKQKPKPFRNFKKSTQNLIQKKKQNNNKKNLNTFCSRNF